MLTLSHLYSNESETIWYSYHIYMVHAEIELHPRYPYQGLFVRTSLHFAQLFTSRSFFELALPRIASSAVVHILQSQVRTLAGEIRASLEPAPRWLQIHDSVLAKSQTVTSPGNGVDILDYGALGFGQFRNLRYLDMGYQDDNEYKWTAVGSEIKELDDYDYHPEASRLKCLRSVDTDKKTLKSSWDDYLRNNHSIVLRHVDLDKLESGLAAGCKVYMLVRIYAAAECALCECGLHTTNLVSHAFQLGRLRGSVTKRRRHAALIPATVHSVK